MANANLMNANASMLEANSYNPGTDIAAQFGNVMAAQETFQVKLNEDATKASENLSADAVGVDLMSGEAQEVIMKDFDDLGMEIATARANGNKKLVRELEMKGANLIAMQENIGSLLKDHAENKLSNNYSKSADQDMLDLLITKQYTLEKDDEGQYRIKFKGPDLGLKEDSTFTSEVNAGTVFGVPNQKEVWQKKMDKAVAENDEQEIKGLNLEKKRREGKGYERDWQKEGILISDLDKHIRVKDDGQADAFGAQLEKISTASNKGKDYSVIKNETQRLITETIDTTDKLQTALFDNSFSQDNKTLAEIYAEEKQISKIEAFEILGSSGVDYKENEEETRKWVQSKLNLAAENKHNQSSKTYSQMTEGQRNDQNTYNNVNTFFDNVDFDNPNMDDLTKLGDKNTKFKISEPSQADIDDPDKDIIAGEKYITVLKYNSSTQKFDEKRQISTRKNSIPTLKELVAEELGMKSYSNYSTNKTNQ